MNPNPDAPVGLYLGALVFYALGLSVFGLWISRRVTDSRQLTDWGRILVEPEAIAYLRRTPAPTFERAWFRSGGQALSVSQALLFASDRIQETVPLVSEYTENDDVKNGVAQCARFFGQVLGHFPDIGERYGLSVDD